MERSAFGVRSSVCTVLLGEVLLLARRICVLAAGCYVFVVCLWFRDYFMCSVQGSL
jgi:hypothetical protein